MILHLFILFVSVALTDSVVYSLGPPSCIFLFAVSLPGVPCITDCVMAELEKLGSKYRVALR